MTVRVYRSTDGSAPSLTGQAGSLVALLDAVLVNGYGSQTAAGWTIAYTAANKRQYAMAAGGTGCQLYVDDSAPTTAKEARITGFLTGTALGTGTGQFPTGAQSAIGIGMLVARKSTTADATARAWTIVADGHTLYVFVETGDVAGVAYPWTFGDFFSYASGDPGNCIIIARIAENTGNAGTGANYSQTSNYVDPFAGLSLMNTTGLSNVINGHFVCSNYNGVGGSLAVGKHADQAKMGCVLNNALMQMGYLGCWTQGSTSSGTTWTTEFGYPNNPDTGLYVSPIWIHHGGMVRGYLKGLWCPLQHLPINHNDTYSGTGNLSGKSFLAQSILGMSNNASGGPSHIGVQCHVETSNTWS